METLIPTSPQLKTVLKTFQLSAIKSLQGPGLALVQPNYCYSPPQQPPTPEQLDKPTIEELPPCNSDEDSLNNKPVAKKRELEFPIPILTAPDQSCSKRCETLLENERISCFVVGGERRLCLPQILNSVLREFTLQQINQVCDELQIYCSRCTRDQLEELKGLGILPRNAPSCGLITQTDAERLVSALLSRSESYNSIANEERIISDKKDLIDKESCVRFKVYHECFGKCKGIFDAKSFVTEDSQCIECLECRRFLSPQRFVRHTHGASENRTCHWGFDSSNWRSYLLLSRDQEHYGKLNTFFQDLKDWQLVLKRKLIEKPLDEKLIKRSKSDVGRNELPSTMYNGNGLGLYRPGSSGPINDQYFQMQWSVFELATRGASAFRPWNPAACKHRESSPLVPPYLSQGPPVLQHPERVVPLSECERFEPHFQPNVALAPIPAPPLQPLIISPTPLPPSGPPSTNAVHLRRHHPDKRRHSHRSSTPEIDVEVKKEPQTFRANVKIENPSSPPPTPIDVISSPYANGSSPACQLIVNEHQEKRLSPIDQINRDANEHIDDDRVKQEVQEVEEEENNADVTSSTTVVVEAHLTEKRATSRLDDIEVDCSMAIELEDRLVALDVPLDALHLARLVIKNFTDEIAELRRENSRLKEHLRQQNPPDDLDAGSIKLEPNFSAVDSTEGKKVAAINSAPERKALCSVLVSTGGKEQ